MKFSSESVIISYKQNKDVVKERVMTISELIKKMPSDINASAVRDAMKATFLDGAKTYSPMERAILDAFSATNFSINNGEIEYFFKFLSGSKHSVHKDLNESNNTGVFSKDKKVVNLSDLKAKDETLYDAVKVFYRDMIDAVGQSFKACTKRLSKYVDHYELKEGGVVGNLIGKDQIAKYNERRNERNETKGVNYFEDDIARSQEVIADLVTFLAVENGKFSTSTTKKEDIETTITAIKDALLEDLEKAGNEIDANIVRTVACALADNELGTTDTLRHFRDSQIQKNIDTMVPEQFKDVAIALDDDKSNYRIAYFDTYGNKVFIKKVENLTDESKAKENLGSDNIDKQLSAIKCLDKVLMEGEADQVIDTFKEGAWLCLVNLAIIDSEVVKHNQERLQQIFAIPLAQCLDKLTAAEIADVVGKVRGKLEKIPPEIAIELDPAAPDTYPTPAPVGKGGSSGKDKESGFKVGAEYKNARKLVAAAVMKNTAGKGVFAKKKARIKNPQREILYPVHTTLLAEGKGIKINTLKGASQNLNDYVWPIELYDDELTIPVLTSIYKELQKNISDLKDETTGLKYTKEQKESIRKKYGLTAEGAQEMIERIFDNYFDENGNKKEEGPTV